MIDLISLDFKFKFSLKVFLSSLILFVIEFLQIILNLLNVFFIFIQLLLKIFSLFLGFTHFLLNLLNLFIQYFNLATVTIQLLTKFLSLLIQLINFWFDLVELFYNRKSSLKLFDVSKNFLFFLGVLERCGLVSSLQISNCLSDLFWFLIISMQSLSQGLSSLLQVLQLRLDLLNLINVFPHLAS